MDSRLDQLDAELREAEEALAALEQQVSRRKSRSPRRQQDAMARDPASSRPARAAQSARNHVQHGRAGGTPMAVEDSTTLHIKLFVPEGSAALGLAFGRGASGSGIVVTDILDESPAMSWNLYHRETGLQERAIRAGDVVVEVNGVWVHNASELDRGLRVEGNCVELQLLRCSSTKTTHTEPSTSEKVDARLPGRCCRAVDAPAAVPVKERTVVPPRESSGTTKSCTFGKGQRFPDHADEGSDPCALVSDHFLSTRPSVSSAVFPPLRDVDLKKMAQRAKKKHLSTLSAYAKGPGLRSVQASLVGLIREGNEAQLDGSDAEDSDDVSTHAGSEGLDRLSILSGASSDVWPSVPGPGDYEPNFKSVSLSLTKGVPSFGRYAPREVLGKRKKTKATGKSGDHSEDSVSQSEATTASSGIEEGRADSAIFAAGAKGGVIAPLPSQSTRCPSTMVHDAMTSSKRPFYDVLSAHQAMDPAQPCLDFAKLLDTGRLKSLHAIDDVGPGAYELKVLAPGADVPTARIGPGFTGSACDGNDATTSSERNAAGPGPSDYDALEALAATLPRSFAADMGRPPPEPHPPVDAQSALSPRWELLCPRVPSTTFHAPLVDPALLPPPRPTPGPGAYKQDSEIARRIRDGMSVQHWHLPSSGLSSGVPEHERGLYDPRPVDRSIRGDSRPLLDPGPDVLTYRRKFRAFMRYQKDAPTLVDRRWRFYDLGGSPEPLGLADFAHRLDFDDFQTWQTLQARREALAARRLKPSLALAAYSLPSLDVLKETAPRAPNFEKALSRDGGDVTDSPREGDVLYLSLDAEKDLMHSRVTSVVNMSKQLGRSRSAPPDLTGDDVNEEELLLSPRQVRRRVPTFVDMTKGSREPLAFSADVWATQNGVVYTYRRTSDQNDTGGETLELDVSSHAHVRVSDFGLPLGRPGHDPRVPTADPEGTEQELMLHWRPVAPRPAPKVTESLHADRIIHESELEDARGRDPPVAAASPVLHGPAVPSDARQDGDAEG